MSDSAVRDEGAGEQVIARILHQRMQVENSLIPGEREAVAYRIAEVMVTAKELYTQYLPRLIQEGPQETSLEDEISGLRMALLHLRDLVSDFDNAFLEAMFRERQANPDQVYDNWAEASDSEEWTNEELGLADGEELEG